MLLLDFQSQPLSTPAIELPSGQGVDVSLTAGGHLAFSTYSQSIEIIVRRGRVWLTDGPVDHVLSGTESHECPPRSRVVISGLTDASLTVRVHPGR